VSPRFTGVLFFHQLHIVELRDAGAGCELKHEANEPALGFGKFGEFLFIKFDGEFFFDIHPVGASCVSGSFYFIFTNVTKVAFYIATLAFRDDLPGSDFFYATVNKVGSTISDGCSFDFKREDIGFADLEGISEFL
jgi:hypothetical protein